MHNLMLRILILNLINSNMSQIYEKSINKAFTILILEAYKGSGSDFGKIKNRIVNSDTVGDLVEIGRLISGEEGLITLK